MDTPQMLTLALAAGLLFIVYKSTFLSRGSLRFDQKIPWAIFLTYVACIVALYFVVSRWSAEDVRGDSETVLFYFAACGIDLGMMQEVFRWCGVSLRDDAIERRNPAAAIVGVGQIVAVTFCIAGSNVGNGPGPEVVAFCLVLSSGALVGLWLLLDRVGGVNDTLTIERDVTAGFRIAAWCVATGAVMGASVAGDWTSYSETTWDFAKYGWPVLALLAAEALIERHFALRRVKRSSAIASATLAGAELVGGLAYAAWVLHT
jgi:hypothetical protein